MEGFLPYTRCPETSFPLIQSNCFLSKWTKQSEENISIRCRELKSVSVKVQAKVGDVFQVPNTQQDVVYLDPPYTKRQYASYYHILETVALGDEPVVEGVAGLRPWKDRASDFCYKRRALKTLSNLVQSLQANRVLLSYSSEGHICMEDMHEYSYKRVVYLDLE